MPLPAGMPDSAMCWRPLAQSEQLYASPIGGFKGVWWTLRAPPQSGPLPIGAAVPPGHGRPRATAVTQRARVSGCERAHPAVLAGGFLLVDGLVSAHAERSGTGVVRAGEIASALLS